MDIQVFENFITEEEEKEIIEIMQKYYNTRSNLRQVVRMGSFMPYVYGTILDEVPSVFVPIQQRLIDMKLTNVLPTSISVNMYPAKTKIAAHIDDITMCGHHIMVVGLCTESTLIFKKPRTNLQEIVRFPRRAIMVMQGEKRYKWTHETLPIDTFRMSVVFREPKENE